MQMIASWVIAELPITIGEGRASHPVVIRMTPWSWEIISSPCEKIPPVLQVMSGCDCRSVVGGMQATVQRALLFWALGQRAWVIRDSSSGWDWAAEARDYVDSVMAAVDAAATRPSLLLGETGLKRLRLFLQADSAGEPWTGEEEFDAGGGGLGVPGTVGLENFLAALLDSGDLANIWLGLACLRKASPDRIARLLGNRIDLAMQWPVIHRAMMHQITYQVSRGLRRSHARRNLKRTLLTDPALGYSMRCKIMGEVSHDVREQARKARDRRHGCAELTPRPVDD